MPSDSGVGREYRQLDPSKFGEDKDPKNRQIEDLNRILRQLYDRLDALEGRRGTVQLGANIDLNEHKVTNSNADMEDDGDLISLAYADLHYGAIAIAKALSISGENPFNVSGLRGQLVQAQPAAAPQGNVDVILDTALDGTLFVQDNILYRVDASVSPAVAIPISGTAVVLSVSHATRVADYNPADYAIGTLLLETDRHYLYAVEDNAGHVWQWTGGIYVAAVASRPADLTVNDLGAPFFATDQNSIYIWTGAAWDTITRRILFNGGFFAIFAATLGASRTYTLPDATDTFVLRTLAQVLTRKTFGDPTDETKALALALAGATTGTTTTLNFNQTANRAISMPDATGGLTYATAALTSGDILVGGGGSLINPGAITVASFTRISATIALTAQTATTGPTTIASAGSQYRFSYTLLVTTADALSVATVQVSINYTDDIGATSQAGSAVAVAATNRERADWIIERASGNVTYTVTLTGVIGTAQYAFYATLERLS